MKTVEIARSSCTARRLPGSLLAFVATLALSLSGNAQTVTTVGGGPNSLPVTIENSRGSGDGPTRNGTDGIGQNPGAKFNGPWALALDSANNMYVADRTNNAIRKISNAGNLATSFTTTIITGLLDPVDVKVDSSGTLYVLTAGDGAIRRYSNGGTLLGPVFVGLSSPTAFAIDSATNSFVTENGGLLKRVTIAGVSTTLSGLGVFVTPRGVSILTTNSLAVSDSHRIQFFSLTNNTVTLSIGTTTAGFSNGLAATALFNTPHHIATAPDGSVLVADRGNHRVRIVSPSGFVNNLYGVPTNQWFVNFPGWFDGVAAHAREPVGITVGSGGTNIFVSEVAWNLLRSVGGVSFAPLGSTAGTNTTTNPGVVNSNLVANLISFGFQSGEGSSDFVGGGGGFYYAPVTLNLMPGQSIYSMLLDLGVTNETGPLITIADFRFDSLLTRPAPEIGVGAKDYIHPGFVIRLTTNLVTDANGLTTTNISRDIGNGVFTNLAHNILGVSWLEVPGTPGHTNLYDTTSQDLVTTSQAYVHEFSKPNVLVGAFAFKIPPAAPQGSAYRIQVFNASGSSNMVDYVAISAPTNGSVGAGFINSIKRVTVGIRPYLVGDVSQFRWFNAGDFGDGTLAADDAQQILMTGFYGHNRPPTNSDFFNSFDSSNGATNLTLDAYAGNIDTVLDGDGELNIDDVFVTTRRALDPYSKWFVRYWSNGVLNVAETTNTLTKPTYGLNRPATQLTVSSSTSDMAVVFKAGDSVTSGGVITIPITAEVSGDLPLKMLMLRMTVRALDSTPNLIQPVQFQFLAGSKLGSPYPLPGSNPNPTPSTYFILWMNSSGFAPGLTQGTTLIGNLVITLPPSAPSNSAYSIHFDHASASPNGIMLFKKSVQDGLLTLSDRSTSSYNDGIPDSWRLRHFGSLYNILSLANADADGDGIPNWAEYKAGTDPVDAQSAFKVRSVTKDGANGITIRWPSIAGKSYQIEFSDSPVSSTWTSAGIVVGTGGEMTYVDTSNTGGARFYRVHLVESSPSQ